MKKTTTARSHLMPKPASIKPYRALAFLLSLSIIPVNAEDDEAKIIPKEVKKEIKIENKQPKEMLAINFLVDMIIESMDDEEREARLADSGIDDFKATLEREGRSMTENIYGTRLVSGNIFSALIDEIVRNEINSFYSHSFIGVTPKHAYIETVCPIATYAYIAIVRVSLDDLPAATIEKMQDLQRKAK